MPCIEIKINPGYRYDVDGRCSECSTDLAKLCVIVTEMFLSPVKFSTEKGNGRKTYSFWKIRLSASDPPHIFFSPPAVEEHPRLILYLYTSLSEAPYLIYYG